MEGVIKIPYEISLWEERLVFVTANHEYVESIPKENTEPIINQYYQEYRIATIGSNIMDSPIKTINNKFKKNVNGTSTLTFSIYSHYYDEESGEIHDNPFKTLLVNERKVKLRYGAPQDCKWYDFVIKNVQEDSEGQIFTYTANDLFVNELSKNGFNLIFDRELENNVGTINVLGQQILKGSDWRLKNTDLLLDQTREEPVYKVNLKEDLIAEFVKAQEVLSIPKGSDIYVIYSCVQNKEQFLQFAYVPKDQIKVDEKGILTSPSSAYFTWVRYEGDSVYSQGTELFNIKDLRIFKDFRVNKYIRKQLTKYDKNLDKYVKVYTKKDYPDQTVYGYTDVQYLTSESVQNYVTNSKNFTNTIGWKGNCAAGAEDHTNIPDIDVAMVPDITNPDVPHTENTTSYLRFFKTKDYQLISNSGISDYRTLIKDLAPGERFIFRIKGGTDHLKAPIALSSNQLNFQIKIASYTVEKDGTYKISEDKNYFKEVSRSQLADGTYELHMECIHSLSFKELIEVNSKVGIFVDFPSTDNTYYFIENMQFFKEQYDDENKLCVPEQPIAAKVQKKYYYYSPEQSLKGKDDITYLYKDIQPSEDFIPKYPKNEYEKIRTITEKESNRFNLLQTLCETFQCWIRFEIEHDASGRIIYGKDSPKYNFENPCPEEEKYRQQKWIEFYSSVVNENDIGFKYGINLKSIKRTVESEGIVSKIIVKSNSNEFARHGSCNIARAEENDAKENFLLDFSYYINQGMLDRDVVNQDLYASDDTQKYLGYYTKLRKYNIHSQQIIEEQSSLSTAILNAQKNVTTYSELSQKTSEQLKTTYVLFRNITGKTYYEFIQPDNKDNAWWNDDEIKGYMNFIVIGEKNKKTYEQLLEQAKKELLTLQGKYDANDLILKNNIEEKKKINHVFYQKYSRFIQEGPWINEDYIDDDLYFLDAEQTLHLSSQPKVSYNIDVIELSQLEGYEQYKFNLGDKSFIEDTKFFGWTFKNGLKAPYKEEVIVSEIEKDLDSPELNNLTIQNFRTQFEDLFQRITASTQSLEFRSGQYNKVSNIIEPNGQIKLNTLQNSINQNSVILQNAKNQSVIWDENGITATSLSAPNEKVRIVSGGIFLSNDGGINWNTGITGNGINASYITTGELNTNVINLYNGDFPSFRWDGNGLSAYKFDVVNGKPANFNFGRFIRLDQYGLYAINTADSFDPNIPELESDKQVYGEDKIRKHSDFSLTWKGFQLKSRHPEYDGGYISITSENDIEVKNGRGNTQVKIGFLGLEDQDKEKPVYGIRILDQRGAIILDQGSNGEVWIRDKIKIGHLTSTVNIGFLEGIKTSRLGVPELDDNGQKIHQVINANEKFIVHEDGSIRAKSAVFDEDCQFTGIIYATGGRIGNVSIGEVTQDVEQARIKINSDQGDTFKINQYNQPYPLQFELTLGKEGVVLNPEQVKWTYSLDFVNWFNFPTNSSFEQNKLAPTLRHKDADFKNGTFYVKVNYFSEGKEYSDYKTFYEISDGVNGVSPIQVKIFSSAGDVFLNSKGETILTATVTRGEEDITSHFKPEDFIWKKYDQEGIQDTSWTPTKLQEKCGNKIKISHLEVDKKAVFKCAILI